MRKMLLSFDRLVRRGEGAWWLTLAVCSLVFPWAGLEPPMVTHIGEGYVAMDSIITGALWMAAAAQLARIVQGKPDEHVTIRTAAWLMLLTLCLLAGRMTWILATAGDIRITTTMAFALLSLSLAVLLHAAGRVIYGRE